MVIYSVAEDKHSFHDKKKQPLTPYHNMQTNKELFLTRKKLCELQRVICTLSFFTFSSATLKIDPYG